mgnify:FL=1|jgi:hypothetical protein|tara:strand:+ start:3280 stop:3786 length:507 start_codon:yes stop_codon:yes gene_type:complete
MKKEILNKVENSSLRTIDLDSLIPNNPRIIFDIKDWLKNDLILIEKDFRELVKNHNWDQYSGKFVSIQCSNDAIIPDWAYMLISKSLKKLEIENFIGTLDVMEHMIVRKLIYEIDLTDFVNKSVIIKGCSIKSIPKASYSFLIDRLQPIVKRIMFGEACSSVPIFKKS